MRKHSIRGSFTLEAAFVFPCVLFIIIGLLYLGFYMHDKIRIQSVLDQTATKGRLLIRNEGNMDSGFMDYDAYLQRGIFYILDNDVSIKRVEIYDYLEEKLSNGLFIADIQSIDVTVSLSKIHMEVSANMQFPFMEVRKLFFESGLSIRHRNDTEIHNPVEFIRVFEVFTGVTDQSEAVDKVLKKLQKILSSFR